MKTNETSQATYVVEKSTILNVRHENGMRTQYELDEDKGCLQLKSVYMKDEGRSVVKLPAFIIFEDVNFPVTSIAACVLKDMQEYGKIKKVILPPTVTCVSEFAFVHAPKSMSQIETSDPELLENVYIPDGVEVLTDSFETVDLRPKHHFRYTNKKEGYSLLFCMNESGNKLTLSDYENIAKGISVVIPKEVNGFPVTKIGDKAFSWCANLTGIVIPDSIREIGEGAFLACDNLTNLVIPDSVVRIRSCAFVKCDHLTGIVIPDSVMDIEDSILCGCDRLSTIVVAEGNKFYDSRESCNAIIETATNTLVQGCAFTVVPDTVEVIGYKAFNTCVNLEHMVVPNPVTKISENAFCYCPNLKTLVLSDSVEEIGEYAFWGCESLVSIDIPESVTKIGQHAFGGEGCVVSSIKVAEGNLVYDSREDCNAIIESDTNTLIAGCSTTVIPDTVTKIGDSAFENCSELTSIQIPDSVTEIGNEAFWECESLISIDIPESVTKIGHHAFFGCESLTFAIPDSVTEIGESAFVGCESPVSIDIPESVTKIGQYAFGGEGCFVFSIKVAEGNLVYDSREDCNAIIETATNTLLRGCTTTVIPDTVTKIGDSAFENCSELTSIQIPDSVTEIGNDAFGGCESLVSIGIPESVTKIGEWAFRGCESLTSIAIPDSVTEIGEGTFDGCESLASIIIPVSVTKIGEWAFRGCSGLTSIVIPDSVQQIGYSVFEGCTGLRQIIISDASLLERAELPEDVKIVDKTAAITEVVQILKNEA